MKKTALALLLVLLSVPSLALAGAWTTPMLHSWHKLAFNYFSSDENFDNDGDIERSNADFTDWNLSYYGQLGLTGFLDVWTTFAYKNLTFEDDAVKRETSGIGDIDLAVKGRFLQKPLVASAQFTFTSPWAYDTEDNIVLGDNVAAYELRLLLGRSLYPVPGYVGLEGGYKLKEGDFADQWRYLVEVGFQLWKIYARAKLDGYASAQGVDPEELPENPTATFDSALGKLESTLGIQIIKFIGVEGSYTYPLWGRNTALGDTFSVGVTGSF